MKHVARIRRASLVATSLGLLATSVPSRADDGDEPPHYLTALGWTTLELALPAIYYFETQNQQEVDWTMRWDRPSWQAKLFTLDALRWDTNSFEKNATDHPLAGVGDYQIGRSNGFGMLGSELLAFGAGVFWEYVVEFHENPSINDLIMNPAGGIAVGEPLYQLGQLWRGGVLSWGDRARTALFSPFDAVQDLWRTPKRWRRPRAWHDFMFTAGVASHDLPAGATRDELRVGADFDLVRHGNFLLPDARSGAVAPGAWSRVAMRYRFADAGGGARLVGVWFHSRTTIAGHYAQTAGGDGMYAGLGAALSYRRDWLGNEWDRAVFAHLLGPQLQFSHRSLGFAARWDLGAYGDFAMIQAHVFGPVPPFPHPPPLYSTVQADGYYDGAGGSLITRLRTDVGPWHLDGELSLHRVWQLDGADRSTVARTDGVPVAPQGMTDWRSYWYASFGYQTSPWGISAFVEGAARRGSWEALERTTSDLALGVVATFER